MSGRNYERLTIEEFGHKTLRTQDLDPVYDALNKMEWDEAQRDRWLLAYWLCYHPGAACWLSETDGGNGDEGPFWSALAMAAANQAPTPLGDRWPRAPERRHWRGTAAVNSVAYLRDRYESATDMVMYCAGGTDGWGDPEPYSAVKKRVEEHYAFGSWIAYKVADMLERCCGVPVRFTRSDAMYESPRKFALRLWLQRAGLPSHARPRDEDAAVNEVVDYLLEVFKYHPAPGGGRQVGLPEIETILCKAGSHENGYYPLNHDLIEISEGVRPWSQISQTANNFLRCLPPIG